MTSYKCYFYKNQIKLKHVSYLQKISYYLKLMQTAYIARRCLVKANKASDVPYVVTIRCFRVNIVVVQKQKVLYIKY
jgi:hypothetical protein